MTDVNLEQLFRAMGRAIASQSNAAVETTPVALPPSIPDPHVVAAAPILRSSDIDDILNRLTERVTDRVLGALPIRNSMQTAVSSNLMSSNSSLPSETKLHSSENQASRHIPEATNVRVSSTSQLELRLNWDGQPNGNITRTFTREERALMGKHFLLHWAHTSGGNGRAAKKGDPRSPNLEGGRVLNYTCLGVYFCDNPNCKILRRPHTNAQKRAEQLGSSCSGAGKQSPCGYPLIYKLCSDTHASITEWSKGFTFTHSGYHDHDPPSLSLHPNPDARRDFAKTVIAHPDAGPR